MNKDYTGQASTFINADAKRKAGKGKADKVKADNLPLGYAIKPESKTKRLNLLVRPSIYEALKSKADTRGISINEYINELITREVESK